MRVTQIKAVARKIYDEIQETITKEREDYFLSFEYANALREFKSNDPIALAIKSAMDFMHTNDFELITEVKVALTLGDRNRRYYNYKMISKDDDVDDILKTIYNNSLRFNYTYTLPDSVEYVFNLLEYSSITSSNILDVEEKVKNIFKTNASGFNAYREES